MFHDEVGDVEFEAGAFEAEAFHAFFLFAQANNEADYFTVKARRDFVLGTTSMARSMRVAMTASFRRLPACCPAFRVCGEIKIEQLKGGICSQLSCSNS